MSESGFSSLKSRAPKHFHLGTNKEISVFTWIPSAHSETELAILPLKQKCAKGSTKCSVKPILRTEKLCLKNCNSNNNSYYSH